MYWLIHKESTKTTHFLCLILYIQDQLNKNLSKNLKEINSIGTKQIKVICGLTHFIKNDVSINLSLPTERKITLFGFAMIIQVSTHGK